MSHLFAASRFWPLEKELRAGRGPCPFVVRGDTAGVALLHYDAGRDATYVVVRRLGEIDSVEIGYAPFVEGTMLIYDATAETMQGKARPFTCDLKQASERLYAILPVQIESLQLRLMRDGNDVRLHAAYLDAQEEVIQAALPLAIIPRQPNGPREERYATTDREGRLATPLAADFPPGALSQWAIRSLLTGREQAAVREPD